MNHIIEPPNTWDSRKNRAGANGTGIAALDVMSEVLAIGFLKNELLKAAARKRKQATRPVQPGLLESRSESKLARQSQDKRSR